MRITATPLVLAWKTILTLFAVVMYMYALGRMKVTVFFFAYFTYWAATANCMYLLLSGWNSWICFLDEPGIVAAWCIHCTWRPMWLLFEIATHSGLGSAVGMWGAIAYFGGIEELKQGKPLDASDIVWHGLMLILTMVDGVAFNNIEFRWAHWSGVLLPLAIVYILWTVIHAYAIGENPELSSDDDEFNDDAIYAIIAWKEDWVSSLLICLISFFGLGFLGFGFLRLVSSRIRSILRRGSQQGMYVWMGVSNHPVVVSIPSFSNESLDEGEKQVTTYA